MEDFLGWASLLRIFQVQRFSFQSSFVTSAVLESALNSQQNSAKPLNSARQQQEQLAAATGRAEFWLPPSFGFFIVMVYGI